MQSIWIFLQQFWKSAASFITLFGVLYGFVMVPSRIQEIQSEYPWIKPFLTTEFALAAVCVAFVFYVFWVDLRRYMEFDAWLNLDKASREFRDELGVGYAGSAAEMFDGLVAESNSETARQETFLAWLIEGINNAGISVRGKPINGEKKKIITAPVIDSTEAYNTTNLRTISDEYTDLEVKRSTIRKLVSWMRRKQNG